MPERAETRERKCGCVEHRLPFVLAHPRLPPRRPVRRELGKPADDRVRDLMLRLGTLTCEYRQDFRDRNSMRTHLQGNRKPEDRGNETPKARRPARSRVVTVLCDEEVRPVEFNQFLDLGKGRLRLVLAYAARAPVEKLGPALEDDEPE